MLKVSIIIPAWNLWATTLQCLESIARSHATHILSQELEIIVVDNGSTDETATALEPTLQRLFANQAKVITLPSNLGFAKACNIGAGAASNELLFFLNNDTILNQNALNPLIHCLENNSKIGIVGPLLLYPDQKVQHCGICISPTSHLDHIYQWFPATHSVVQKTRYLQAITGAAMLISAKLFSECGNFFEGYINGFEDIDLCCAVRSKGLLISCVPTSQIYHLTSQTPGRFLHDAANAELLKQRYPGKPLPDLHIIAAEDGFEPRFSPSFDVYIGMPKAKEAALNMVFSNNFNLEKCLHRLCAEPLWFGGYELVANYYEKQGQLENALECWLHLTNIAPLEQYFAHVHRIAQILNEVSIAEQAEQVQGNIKQLLNNTEELNEKLLKMKNMAEQYNDKTLFDMVQAWQEQYIKG